MNYAMTQINAKTRISLMTKHLEVPFDNNGAAGNATVQLDTNGVYVTLEGKPPVYIERRHVEAFIGKWNEVQREKL